MKKLLSVFVTAVIAALLMVPVSAADTPVLASDYLYLGFEAADEAELGAPQSNAKKELNENGVFGSAGALQVTVSDASGYGAIRYDLSTEARENYNISVYLNPLEMTFGTVKAIFYHDALKNGEPASGFEEITLKQGETTEDGYTRYYIDNYKMNTKSRVYASAADGGSQNYPKTDDLATTLEIRVGAQGTYLMDELKCQPISDKVLQYDNFDTVGGIPGEYSAYVDGQTPLVSDLFSAVILPHVNARYMQNSGSGHLKITGSGEQGAYFTEVHLMPATTYRLSAKVQATTDGTDSQIRAYIHNPTNTDITSDTGNFSFSDGKMYGPTQTYTKDGQWHEFEYYFRTKNTMGEAYSQDGFVFDRIGICSNGSSYIEWYLDDLSLEEVDELPYNGSFSDNGFTGSAYNGTTSVPAFVAGDKFTTLTPVEDDGTNADRGDYLKVSLVGNENGATGTTRRLRACVNLTQGQKYRLSFWMKLTEDSTLKTAKALAMHNIGKVDGSYGNIAIPDNDVTTEWKKYTVDFNVQNAQMVGDLYIGINDYKPEQDACFAIDEIKLEPIGAGYSDAVLTRSGSELTATETTGAHIGTVLEKYYNFYVSEDGTNYAKAGTNSTGTFTLRGSDNGKYMKSEVIGTREDGSVARAESAPVLIADSGSGFDLHFTSTLADDTITAEAVYTPADGETVSFDAIIALYGEGNELLGAEKFTSSNNTAQMSIANQSGVVKAKIFIWNSLDSAIPLVQSKALPAN